MDATTKSSLKLTLPSDREIVMTRVFEAPRRLVFEACTRPEHVKRWYGCNQLAFAVCEIDFRVGGGYRFVMRAPDGVEHTMRGVYREIVAPERIVHTDQYQTTGFTSPEALVTVSFVEEDGRTRLTSTILHASREARDGHLGMGMERGASETMDRLEALLRTME